jgi:hypothetical protein
MMGDPVRTYRSASTDPTSEFRVLVRPDLSNGSYPSAVRRCQKERTAAIEALAGRLEPELTTSPIFDTSGQTFSPFSTDSIEICDTVVHAQAARSALLEEAGLEVLVVGERCIRPDGLEDDVAPDRITS